MSDDHMKDLWEEMKRERALDLKTLKVTSKDPILNHGGGAWLGCVRNYIQCKCVNGENVTWGSHDSLTFRGGLTVYDMEHLAAEIAANAVNEFIQTLRHKGVK